MAKATNKKVDAKGNVFGIIGKVPIPGVGKFLTDEKGNVKVFKGEETELMGTGEDYKDYQGYIIEIEMATRESTRRGKDTHDGYAARVTVLKKTGKVKKMSDEDAEKLNSLVDWRYVATPHHLVWLFPKDSVQLGEAFVPKCEWVSGNMGNNNSMKLIIEQKTK
jgi:hypothetical protein